MRWLCIICVLGVLSGCVSPPALPPRYIEPSLPLDRLALIVAKGDNIGVLSVDGAIACNASDYSVKGLNKTTPGPSVRLAPGTHMVTFACDWSSGYAKFSTNMTVSAGERYSATFHIHGYSPSLSIQLDF